MKFKADQNLEHVRKLFITPDLTPLEQRKNNALRQQLADMNKIQNIYVISKLFESTEIMLQLMSITLPLLPGLTEMAAGLPPDNSANSLNPYSVFKLFVINCRGLKSKKDSFVHLIHSQSPHFIAGTESWLDPTTLSNEIFPVNYQVF